MVQGLGFKVQGLGFKGFMVQGFSVSGQINVTKYVGLRIDVTRRITPAFQELGHGQRYPAFALTPPVLIAIGLPLLLLLLLLLLLPLLQQTRGS
jgi:hypothetical protein